MVFCTDADTTVHNADGDTALMIAAAVEHARLDPDTTLRVTALLNAGADVNAVDHKQNTALMKAKDVARAKVLLDAGADPDMTNWEGKTALSVAECALVVDPDDRNLPSIIELLETVTKR